MNEQKLPSNGNTNCSSQQNQQPSAKTSRSELLLKQLFPCQRSKENTDCNSAQKSSPSKGVFCRINLAPTLFSKGTKEKDIRISNRHYKVVVHDNKEDEKNNQNREAGQPIKKTEEHQEDKFCSKLKKLMQFPYLNRCTLNSMAEEEDISVPKKQCTCKDSQAITTPPPFAFCIGSQGIIIVQPDKKDLQVSKGCVKVAGKQYNAVMNLSDYKRRPCRDNGEPVCTCPKKSYCKQKRVSRRKYFQMRRKAAKKSATGKGDDFCPCINKDKTGDGDKNADWEYDDDGAGGDSIPGFSFKLRKCQLDEDKETGTTKDEDCLIRDQEEERFLKQGYGLQPVTLIMNEPSNTPLRMYEVSPSQLTRYFSVESSWL